MAVSEIQKICLIGHKKHQEKILERIYELGFLEVIDFESLEKHDISNISELDYKLAQVKFAINFINAYKPKARPKRGLALKERKKNWQKKINNALTPKIFLTEKRLIKVLEKFDYQSFVKRVESLESDLNEKTNLIKKLENELEILLPWKNLSYSPGEIGPTLKTNSRIGIVKKNYFEQLLKEFDKNKPLIEINKIKETEKEIYSVIIYHNSIEERISSLLKKFEFSEVELIYPEKLPSRAVKDIEEKIKILKQEAEKIIRQVAKLDKYQSRLKIIHDYLSWQKEKEEAKNKFFKTEKTFAFIGWVEKHNLATLKEELEKISPQTEIEILPFRKDEKPPVIVRNKNFIRPFESVTNIYGMPRSHEPDPTPYLAPFFILFFGLCLGDAGYGIILAFLSFIAIKILKLPKEKQGMFRLLMYGGFITFIVGVALGSWFGIDLLKIRIINPVEEPLKMLLFALVLGIIQVIVGISINFYWNLKNKDWGRAFDSGLWLYFIFSILFWLLIKANIVGSNFSQLSVYLTYLGIAVIVLTQGRRQKNFLMKLPGGILSLYNLVGYLSDVLSYSRILALGLATSIIAMVINLIAMLFKDMIPYLGWMVAAVILIGGHLFNLAINALGSFIHSGRLQFVEFFPKFMEGGGRRFRPFKKEGRFTRIN